MKNVFVMGVVFILACVPGTARPLAPPVFGDDGALRGEANIPSTVRPEILEKNFLWALSFDVDGVVEDALREVAKAKLEDPTFESRAIMKKVEELAESGNSPAIRYRASLTKIVFEHPDLFCGDNLQCCKEGEEFFTGIVHCLERSRYAQ